jgi:hypothetical protein
MRVFWMLFAAGAQLLLVHPYHTPGLHQRRLARAAGISAPTAERVEGGEPVRFSTGRKVAAALGVEPSPSLGRPLRRRS